MDIKNVTLKIIKAFQETDVRYALIGGYALGLWGVGRATVDIDFLINRDDLDNVDVIMQELGYECKYRSENVSQYLSSLKVFGEVDFIHAFRKHSIKMIDKAVEKEVFGGSIKIKVLIPEDLIGLKLQAIKNDPKRKEIDMADIESLIAYHGKHLDWSLIEEYHKIFNMEDLLKEIKKRTNENL